MAQYHAETNAEPIVRHDREASIRKAWMNRLAPLVRLVFKRNHTAVMRTGSEGLARRLGTKLLEIECVAA